MIIRITTKKSGIVEYLKKGIKPNSTISRDEKDLVIPILNNINELDKTIKYINKNKDYSTSYSHITLSFTKEDFEKFEDKNDNIDLDKLNEFVKDYLKLFLSGYSEDEYIAYCELHFPKLKYDDITKKERLAHLHLVVPHLNLMDNTKLQTPFFNLYNNDLIQTYMNRKYDLDLPIESKRENYQAPILSKAGLQRKELQEVLKDIKSEDELLKFFESNDLEFKKVATKKNTYYKIIQPKPLKDINLRGKGLEHLEEIAKNGKIDNTTNNDNDNDKKTNTTNMSIPERIANLDDEELEREIKTYIQKRVEHIGKRRSIKATQKLLDKDLSNINTNNTNIANTNIKEKEEKKEKDFKEKKSKFGVMRDNNNNNNNDNNNDNNNNYIEKLSPPTPTPTQKNIKLSFQEKILKEVYNKIIKLTDKGFYIKKDPKNKEILIENKQKNIKIIDTPNRITAKTKNYKDQVALMIELAEAKGWNLKTLNIKGSYEFKKEAFKQIKARIFELRKQELIKMAEERIKNAKINLKVNNYNPKFNTRDISNATGLTDLFSTLMTNNIREIRGNYRTMLKTAVVAYKQYQVQKNQRDIYIDKQKEIIKKLNNLSLITPSVPFSKKDERPSNLVDKLHQDIKQKNKLDKDLIKEIKLKLNPHILLDYVSKNYKVDLSKYEVFGNKINNNTNKQKPKNVIDFLVKEIGLNISEAFKIVNDLYTKQLKAQEQAKNKTKQVTKTKQANTNINTNIKQPNTNNKGDLKMNLSYNTYTAIDYPIYNWREKTIKNKTELETIVKNYPYSNIVFSDTEEKGIVKKGYRSSKTAIAINSLILDFDNEDENKLVTMKQIANKLKSKNIKALLITTKSHNKAKHNIIAERFRVIIPITNNVDLTNLGEDKNIIYKKALEKIYRELEVDKFVDEATYDLARQYRPSPANAQSIVLQGKNIDFGKRLNQAKKDYEIEKIEAKKIRELEKEVNTYLYNRDDYSNNNTDMLTYANINKILSIDFEKLINTFESVIKEEKQGSNRYLKTQTAKYHILNSKNGEVIHDFINNKTYNKISYLYEKLNVNNILQLARSLEKVTGETYLEINTNKINKAINQAKKTAKSFIEFNELVKKELNVKFVRLDLKSKQIQIADLVIDTDTNLIVSNVNYNKNQHQKQIEQEQRKKVELERQKKDKEGVGDEEVGGIKGFL